MTSPYGTRRLSVVVGESVLVDESLDDHDALRTFLAAADRRGHPAPSVVVGDDGTVLTPPRYADRMGVPHLRAGSWAFCRQPTAEAIGLPAGTDWARTHAPVLLFEMGSPLSAEPHFYPQPYLQEFGSAETTVLQPLCAANPVAWSTAGAHLAVLEERLGPVAGPDRYVLWEYEPALGGRRRLADFTNREASGRVELAYSPDDRWILLCFWDGHFGVLVRRDDGWVVPLPVRSRAVAWNPAGGLTTLTFDEQRGDLVAADHDLGSGRSTERRRIPSPTGLPFRVRELSLSPSGRLALVTAPLAESGLNQVRRGDVHVATVIDLEDGTVEPVLPVSTGVPGAQRRHTSPRWCEDPVGTGPVEVADALLAAGRPGLAGTDPAELADDLFDRWAEVAGGISAAWATGRLPRHRYAAEYVQHVLSCHELDPERTDRLLLEPLWEHADRSPAARAVQRVVSRNLGQRLRTLAPLPAAGPEPARPAAPTGDVDAAVLGLIDAGTRAEVYVAAQQLRYGTGRAADGAAWWSWFEAVVAGRAERGDHLPVARAVLAAMLWNGYYLARDPSLARAGLPPVPPEAETALLVTGYLSGHRLPAGEVLSGDAESFGDVEDLLHRIRARLADLPLADHLHRRGCHRTGWDEERPVVDPRRSVDLARIRHAWRPGVHKDVFLSHASEDKEAVAAPLARELTRRGVSVWLDSLEMGIGANLRRRVDEGIAGARFGVIVLSPAFLAKHWTQWELDGLVTMTLAGEQDLLPVWHGLGVEDVRAVSPSLANRLARSTADFSVAEIAAEIAAVVRR